VAVQPGAAFSAPPAVYIADHDTAPQQVVKNDTTSHLIRTLQNKKGKEEAKRKQGKAAGEAQRWGAGSCCCLLGLQRWRTGGGWHCAASSLTVARCRRSVPVACMPTLPFG